MFKSFECKICGKLIQRTSASQKFCVECRELNRKIYHNKYYEINKGDWAKYSPRQKQYYLENKERIDKRSKDYYQKNKVKVAERGKEYRKTHKEQIKQRDRTYQYKHSREKREKNRLEVLMHYSNGSMKCACPNCPETNPKFLTLDHINDDGAAQRKKLFGSNKMTGRFYGWLIQNNYPEEYKLQVACYNCNCGRYRNHGICPHMEKISKV
jgi:phage FluMu protein Com